ncbi:MAG: L,D-transpeptidase [Sphingomonadales bacterium]|nr:MAG: L,D-transpeptidase [Sphingomonadales bacterium]
MLSRPGRALILAASIALLTGAGVAQMRPISTGSVMDAVAHLRPGQYIWAPELAPEGPVLVVVNIATQRLVAYRNGVPIGVSTISTGKAGHRTPLGVFPILQKAKWHRSNLYSNAPMPYMQRLTWGGVALHGGSLPGYPASHGCIRLPHSFAPLLFGATRLGMTVVVVDQPPQMMIGPTPQMAQAAISGPAVWHPELSPNGPVSLIVSAADQRMVVLRNGVQIGSAPVRFNGPVDRVQAYVLREMRGGRYDWAALALPGQAHSSDVPPPAPGRFEGNDPFRQTLAEIVGPGTTMVVMPDSLGQGAGPPPPPEPAVIEEQPAVAEWMNDASVTLGR